MKHPSAKSTMVILIATVVLAALTLMAEMQRFGGWEEFRRTRKSAGDTFTCFTYDDQGRVLEGFWSEREETWYLCVTSVMDVEHVRLYWTGRVADTSQGILNPEKGTVTDGFKKSGDSLLLTQKDGTVQKIVILQSNLPSVYVNLERTNLDKVHADQSVKHENNSIYMMDPNHIWDLTAEGTVTIKGRGNSSWREYEKKGYQIVFDKPTSVLGMEKAEKWVLLANASDDSLMRTQLVSRMAKGLGMDFVASFQYVDLWIDGEYLGTYLMGEKVEVNPARLNLVNPSGALFEHDEDFYFEEPNWFLSEKLNRHFTLKEIVEERDSLMQEAEARFEVAVDVLIQYLYETPSEQVTLDALSQMLDVDSAIKYYLINEYALNRESFSTSFYWYQDGLEDVLHLGPVWDFDTCMGNDKEPCTATYGENHVLFRYLLAAPAFYERTMALLDEYRDELEAMTDDVDVLRAQIAESARMNYLRWDVLGKPNPKGGADFAPTFDAAADTLKQWLQGRESSFQVMQCKIATSVVSDDCSTITVRFQPEQDYEEIMVALWSDENGRDDLSWYRAELAKDGIWFCRIDLDNHNCDGLYHYNIYTDNQRELLSTGQNYVQTAQAPRYDLNVEISDNRELELQLQDTTQVLTAVRVDIWGGSVYDTSFHRLQMEQDAQGIWAAKVPMCAFNLPVTDDLIIQVYGMDQTVELKLREKLFPVEEVFQHSYSERGICTVCGDQFGVEEILAKSPVYCLCNPNTDERFYTSSDVERNMLLSAGWQDEGIGWDAPIFGNEPVYRLMNPNTFDRLFTMDRDEVAVLQTAGWNLEGIGWSSYAGGQPVYRMYNPQLTLGTHRYTASESERKDLMAQGWIDEGICWYGVPGA